MLETPKALSTSTVITLMDVTMDNQQKTDTLYAGYLAAILDGEGYVALIPFQNKGRTGLMPRISLNNFDARILANIQIALNHFQVPYHVYEHKTNKCFDVRIRRLTGLRKFLSVVLATEFVGKHQEAILLKQFLDGRFDNNEQPVNNRTCKYTKRDFQIASEIKAIRTSQRAYVQRLHAEDVLHTAAKAG